MKEITAQCLYVICYYTEQGVGRRSIKKGTGPDFLNLSATSFQSLYPSKPLIKKLVCLSGCLC